MKLKVGTKIRATKTVNNIITKRKIYIITSRYDPNTYGIGNTDNHIDSSISIQYFNDYFTVALPKLSKNIIIL